MSVDIKHETYLNNQVIEWLKYHNDNIKEWLKENNITKIPEPVYVSILKIAAAKLIPPEGLREIMEAATVEDLLKVITKPYYITYNTQLEPDIT